MQRTNKPNLDRRALATQAMQAAAATRVKAGVGQSGPVCIYGVCETLGVTVRFNYINMEGMYQRGAQPRIHLSARRPLPRRAFNCAHELGHHVFHHGTSIDELREDAKAKPWEDPKEFLADTFAGFMMMPTIGLRRAFKARGCSRRPKSPLFAVCRGLSALRRDEPRGQWTGLYFERMTNFSKVVPSDGNQLEFILSCYNERAGVRDTMLQVAIFDPARDHIKTARLGFPCLQHLSFVPTKEGLVVNAFYATQYVFDKAYGNYLGLARLGAFMAHEMDLPLARLNVTVGVAKLDGVKKSDASLAPLIAAARAAVEPPSVPSKVPRPSVSARGASA